MSLRVLLLSWLAALAIAGTAQAQSGHGPDVVSVDLLPGWRTADGTHMTGLHIKLAPGWKTYWRAPGEAGLPPVMDWGRSRNLAGALMRFPSPRVYEVNGYRTIGYSNEVVLPIELTPERGNAPIKVRGRLNLGVCEDICMPMTVAIRAELPPVGGPDPRITAAIADQPQRSRAQPECRWSHISDGLRLEAELPRMREIAGKPVAVFETPDPRVWVSDAMVREDGARKVAVVDFVPPRGGAMMIDRSSVRLTVIGSEGGSVEMLGCR